MELYGVTIERKDRTYKRLICFNIRQIDMLINNYVKDEDVVFIIFALPKNPISVDAFILMESAIFPGLRTKFGIHPVLEEKWKNVSKLYSEILEL